jgi:hypothetical protein
MMAFTGRGPLWSRKTGPGLRSGSACLAISADKDRCQVLPWRRQSTRFLLLGLTFGTLVYAFSPAAKAYASAQGDST